MSALTFVENRNAFQEARIAEAAASILPEICAFLHAVQIERETVTAIPAIAPPASFKALRRGQTDTAAEAMLTAISRHAALMEGPAAAAPLATLRIAQTEARNRGRLRDLVDHAASVEDVTLAYSATVDRLLAGIVRLRHEAPNQQIANSVLGLISQLRISELAVRERTAGAVALAQGGFAPGAFTAFSSLSMRQDAVLEGLHIWVAPDIVAAVNEAIDTPQARAFVNRRTALLSGRGAVGPMSGDVRAWQDLAGARIRALIAAERHTIARLSGALTEARRAAQRRVRHTIAVMATIGGLLAGAGLLASAAARRVLGGLIGLRAHPAAGCAPGGTSAMMIVDSNGLVAFITPGLDEALLRSRRYFNTRRPDAEFTTIKGQNVNLFDTAAPGGFRAMLGDIVDGPAGDLRFDGRRFSIVSSRVTGCSGKPGHMVEWIERSAERGAKPGFGFGRALPGRRAAGGGPPQPRA